MLLILALALAIDAGDAKIVRTFTIPEESEAYLNMPFSFDFDEKGKLFLLDRDNMKVFVWDENGAFLKTFAKQGEGPGELTYPIKIDVRNGEVWVWDLRRRISIYDTEGNFQNAVVLAQVEPRNFAIFDERRALIGYRQPTEDHKLNMVFQWVSRDGTLGQVLESFPNHSVLAPVEQGSNKTTIVAYGPEIDLQRDGRGNLYIGYSQQSKLYRLDREGKIAETIDFQLPTGKPTEAEREIVEKLSLPLPTGGRFVLSEVPGLEISYDHDKAYWTNFVIKGDKVAFVLTPLGTLRGVGNGFHRAGYVVCDLDGGKVEKRGRYAFPEDSTVLYRNGRILATIADEDTDFVIAELTLEGL